MIGGPGVVELHDEVGITVIEIEGHAVFNLAEVGARRAVLVCPAAHGAEGHKGAQAQRSGRVGFEQRVANEEPIALVAEDDFLLQHHTADAVDPSRHLVPLEALDVFVTARTVVVAHVFV